MRYASGIIEELWYAQGTLNETERERLNITRNQCHKYLSSLSMLLCHSKLECLNLKRFYVKLIYVYRLGQGILKGEVPLTSCLTGLEEAV